MLFAQLFEHDGETLATTLERGKAKINSWYAGFYAGFHGAKDPEGQDEEFEKGFRKGKTVASTKING